MQEETRGSVVAVSRQWWLKVNTKPIRISGADGAVYPHILKVRYWVDGVEYVKRHWLPAGKPVPAVGTEVTVLYERDNPGKAKLL